ncbi:hypothetical protein TVAG_080200 [Trichomonas vaginalis G3]|uniref:NOT2/NOT3/NOT5 C-terminal domain-containing protein n=1 Tax=Trichomonas vaginalis (strain ATCC PRA-98 / G3) TaxID=412133 RepID=A2FBH3_TRIV3|nr:nuclear-transcribed mRNA catabolic process, deadenylation-dependent decay [Trichomonas vaginalis G3]EAX97760.1 hypothetical protein TVAG_080200 [Trichomonas vaginalis G3]KAI5491165.1 nuclear-transcribed mRNA catabolic process, deadenylation-dependent decay [Trichomonas vaginalis G3]|eukprot:XP_001310690.1 hypothetical protein [Trichomonas vaginalis G3]
MSKSPISKKPAENEDFSDLFKMEMMPPAVPQQHISLQNPKKAKNDIQQYNKIIEEDNISREFEQSMKMVPDLPFDFVQYQPEDEKINPDFPKRPAMKLLQPEMFQYYDIYILFYIFYYFPNSPYQYFAAKELKSRGWTFLNESQQWVHLISHVYETTDKDIIGKFEIFDRSPDVWDVVVRNSYSISKQEINKD